MLFAPLAHVDAIDRSEANRLLVAWGHRMGPYTRPSHTIDAHHALFQNGESVAVAVSGETVGQVVGQTGITRGEVVELARLCAARPNLCRVMLRIWREMIFPAVAERHNRRMAISYQDRDLHNGNTYRFDGWVRIAQCQSGDDRRSGRKGRKMAIWGWPPQECAAHVHKREPKA